MGPSAVSHYSLVFPRRFHRPTWAEVDLSRLQENLRLLRRRVGSETRVLFVVKGDGYGHGAVRVSRAAVESGAVDRLGVSSVEEGIALRDAGLRRPILILGSLYPFGSTLAAVRYGLTPTVASWDGARLIAQAAGKAFAAARRFKSLHCHLKLDTGMGRIGVSWPSGLRVALELSRAPGVDLEGVYTHLSCAETDPDFTRLQLSRFKRAARDMAAAGLRVPLLHAANSAGALSYPQSRLDMVRPGIAAYGLYGRGFRPVLSLKTKVVFLKNVRPGAPVSYGGLYRAPGQRRIATLPIGYADGLPRLASIPRERGGKPPCALVRGRRCPVVGAVTMDMTMIDVTKVPEARVGEEAVLIGAQGREEITAAELALSARTITYELLTGLKPRVPRVYV